MNPTKITLLVLLFLSSANVFSFEKNPCMLKAQKNFINSLKEIEHQWLLGQKHCEQLEHHYNASNKCYLRVEEKKNKDRINANKIYRLAKMKCKVY